MDDRTDGRDAPARRLTWVEPKIVILAEDDPRRAAVPSAKADRRDAPDAPDER